MTTPNMKAGGGAGMLIARARARAIVRLIESLRLPLSDEKALQAALEPHLLKHCGLALRENNLGDGDIIDFLVDGVGVEIKIKGQRRAIFRQCQRYCAHDSIQALVLATNAAMGLPTTIAGKPVFVASLGRGWL
ncbi:hypothetical protein ABE438_17510 [Bosea sp. TWI1241]|uniref:hypothetical protein n=1 Tax=Bosea sp. TWI1241 TaxID=3148904 RepID=UPI00320A64BA